jgi:hypothetical protein
MWSAIECNTGIICACLPTLRPPVNSIWPRLLSTLSGSHSQRHTGNDKAPTYRNGTQTSAIEAPGDDVGCTPHATAYRSQIAEVFQESFAGQLQHALQQCWLKQLQHDF